MGSEMCIRDSSNTLSQDETLTRVEKIAIIKEEFKQASNDIAFGVNNEANNKGRLEEELDTSQNQQASLSDFSI